MRLFAALSFMGLLAGCGEADDTGNSERGVPAAPTTTLVSGNTECTSRPDFVPVHAGASIETCVAGPGAQPGQESGTVVYTVPAKAADIKAWYKEQAAIRGMAGAMDVDAPNPLYSAREGDKRTFMMMTAPDKAGTRVTVNWRRQP